MDFKDDMEIGHLPPPVSEGEIYNVKIEDVAQEGDGIAKINDFVIFVPNSKVGEELDVRIHKVLRSGAFGVNVAEEE